MKFLADESCARPVISALREAGHDVLAIAEFSKGVTDEMVMERAASEKRVVITEDRDFGELVYAHGSSSPGVVFVKFPTHARRGKPGAVVEAVTKFGERLQQGFAVVEPGRVRLARRPPV